MDSSPTLWAAPKTPFARPFFKQWKISTFLPKNSFYIFKCCSKRLLKKFYIFNIIECALKGAPKSIVTHRMLTLTAYMVDSVKKDQSSRRNDK